MSTGSNQSSEGTNGQIVEELLQEDQGNHDELLLGADHQVGELGAWSAGQIHYADLLEIDEEVPLGSELEKPIPPTGKDEQPSQSRGA
jgi:hypothetical protein